MQGTIGFIGCGRLGQALLKGWLASEVVQPETVLIHTKRSGQQTAATFGVRSVPLDVLLREAQTIILAVKPYQAQAILEDTTFSPSHLVISTMAGVPTRELEAWVAPARVVRTMPNVGCQIGQGATVAFGGERAAPACRR